MEYCDGIGRGARRVPNSKHTLFPVFSISRQVYYLLPCRNCGSACFARCHNVSDTNGGFCSRGCRNKYYRAPAKEIVNGKKQCSKCGQWKPCNEFDRHKHSATGRSSWCKQCTKAYRDTLHVQVNTALRMSKYTRTEKRKAANREHRKKLYATPTGNINIRMSTGIRHSLQTGKGGHHWEDLVGYTLQELMAHLEFQFPGQPGITWDNIGDWHIDHIRPLSSFTFESPDDPQFKEAWALFNLQPLWAQENMKKGSRWKGERRHNATM